MASPRLVVSRALLKVPPAARFAWSLGVANLGLKPTRYVILQRNGLGHSGSMGLRDVTGTVDGRYVRRYLAPLRPVKGRTTVSVEPAGPSPLESGLTFAHRPWTELRGKVSRNIIRPPCMPGCSAARGVSRAELRFATG